MLDGRPLSRKGSMILLICERSRNLSLFASLRIFLLKRLKRLLLMWWEKNCRYRGSRFQAITACYIVHVIHEAEVGNTYLQQVSAINFAKYWGHIEEYATSQGM